MNEFLNENWKDAYQELSPAIFQVVSEIILSVVSRISEVVPYNNIFPDKLPSWSNIRILCSTCPQWNLILKLSIQVPITKYSIPKVILNVFATKICRIVWINFAISTSPSACLHRVPNKTLELLSKFALLKFVWVFDFWLKTENSNGYLTWNYAFLHTYWAKHIKHWSE
jgi:hypothetical protein